MTDEVQSILDDMAKIKKAIHEYEDANNNLTEVAREVADRNGILYGGDPIENHLQVINELKKMIWDLA